MPPTPGDGTEPQIGQADLENIEAAPVAPTTPETPSPVEEAEELFEEGLPAGDPAPALNIVDGTAAADIQIDSPEPPEASPITNAPATVEAPAEKGEISREEVISRLRGIGTQLNDLMNEFAAPANKPLVNELPSSTEPAEPAVRDNVVSIYTRGQDPLVVNPVEPATRISEVPEALQAHSAPVLKLVPDAAPATDQEELLRRPLNQPAVSSEGNVDLVDNPATAITPPTPEAPTQATE